MEVQLSTVVDLDLLKMKWKEQYVSEGLNRKVAPSQPPGIYQGLRIIENTGSPRQVEIAPDVDTNFHVAVYQSTTGYSMTYWDMAGTSIILDLTNIALSNEETVIGLEMDYTVGVDTTAVWMAFPIADWNALPAARRDEIIVLGTVQVPSSMVANIVTADISIDRATYAWRNLSKGAIAWSQIVRNGDFEQADSGAATAWYWSMAAIAGSGTGTTLIDVTDPQRNEKCIEFSTLTTGSVIFVALQNVNIPVTPGQLGMVRYQKKNLVIPSSGTMDFNLVFADSTGSIGANTLLTTVDTTGVDGSYEEVVFVFEVPVGVTELAQVGIGGGPTYASAPVDVLRIDDVSVWLETSGERNDLQHGVTGDVVANGSLTLALPGTGYAEGAIASYNTVGNKLTLDDIATPGALALDIAGTVDSSGAMTSAAGGIVATTGDIVAATGDIEATAGNVVVGVDLSVGSDVISDLIPDATATRDLGSPTRRWNAVLYDLDVSNDVSSNLKPNTPGQDLGIAGANRWNLFAINIDVSGLVTGDVIPAVDGQDLGDGTKGWDVYAKTVHYSSTQTIKIPISIYGPGAAVGGSSWTGISGAASSGSGIRGNTLNGKWHLPIFGLRDGDQIVGWQLMIYQTSAGGGATVTGRLQRVDNGTDTQLSTATCLDNYGGSGWVSFGATGLSETITGFDSYFLELEPDVAGSVIVFKHAEIQVVRP